MTEDAARRQLAFCTLGYVGTQEQDKTHWWLVEQYNKIKPLPRYFEMTIYEPWCAMFVSVMAKLNNMLDIIPAECGCGEMVKLFQKMNRWQEADDYMPKLGDIIFYDWEDSGSGDDTGEPDHVGIVTKCYENSFTVTEGNYHDSVMNREMVVNGRYIRGFGLPDYQKWATKQNESDIPDWAYDAWKWVKDTGISDGKRPGDKVTRAELWTMLHRYHNKFYKEN